jgi:hypothetical protein
MNPVMIKWVMSKVNEVVRCMELFQRHYMIPQLSPTQIDRVVRLYTKCFHSVAKNDEKMPDDFIPHLHTKQAEQLGDYALRKLWSYAMFLQSSMRQVSPVVTPYSLEKYKKMSARLNQEELTNDPSSGSVLFSTGTRIDHRERKNHVMNAILSILYQLTNGEIGLKDVEFAVALLTETTEKSMNPIKHTDRIVQFLRDHDFIIKEDSQAMARLIEQAMNDLCKDDTAMGRVLFFSEKNKDKDSDDDDDMNNMNDNQELDDDDMEMYETWTANDEVQEQDAEEKPDARYGEEDDVKPKRKTLTQKLAEMADDEVKEEDGYEDGDAEAGDYGESYGRFDNDDWLDDADAINDDL